LLIARLIADPATLETRLDAATAALQAEGLPIAEAVMLEFCSDVLQLMLPGDDEAALRRVLDVHFPDSDGLIARDEIRIPDVFVSDMDSTMIGQECIDELADFAGLKAHVAAITERAMRGEIEFEPALRERVALLKDLPVSVVDEVLAKRITPTPGGRELVMTMRASGAYTCLISGGFTLFTNAVAAKIGFQENRANELKLRDGKLTGEVTEPILGRAAKLATLIELRESFDLDEIDTLVTGDGANDLGMIQAAGLGVAYHAKPAVAAAAAARIDYGDLTALLYAQGYRREEFAD
jgi:phosphoserine phosphatase